MLATREQAEREAHETWLALRRTGVGSSDAADVLGISPDWGRTPLGVYLDKLGLLPERSEARMRWGLKLEEVIATAYEEMTGLCVVPPFEKTTRSRLYPWMLASVDREAEDGRIVELKNVDAYEARAWGEAGTDQVPDHYAAQVLHQMVVLQRDRADIAALFGGNDFKVYHLEYNLDAAVKLLEVELAFWEMVERRTPPPPDWSHPRTPELVQLLHRPDPRLTVELNDPSAVRRADAYERYGANLRAIEAFREEVKAHLVEDMGTAAVARLPDGRMIQRLTRSGEPRFRITKGRA